MRSFEAAKPKSAGFTAAPRDQSREKDGMLDPLLEAAQQVATVLQPESPQPEGHLRRRFRSQEPLPSCRAEQSGPTALAVRVAVRMG